MNKNLDIVAKELFGKLRTQFPKVKLGDEESKVTDEPEKARFFKFEYTVNGKMLGNIDISISDDDGLVVIYSNDIVENQKEHTKNQFFNFLQQLREFAKQKLLSFDTRDISKSNLEKRDYKYMSKENFGEGNMTESKLFGTSKISYQQIGEAKLMVKHSAPINMENPAGRAQRIESIYIENIDGERFKYPFKHLNGARALAQHVAHSGTPYDSIGQHIIGLSEELSKLRMFKHYVERNDTISEAMESITTKVIERIDQVKKEIHHLQVAKNYETFAESFTEQNEVIIPEDLMNDWIDRLTIRTFNEELKNVFPYIFKLVDESDIPVKELTADDLVEFANDTVSTDTAYELPELSKFEDRINSIIGERTDIFSGDADATGPAIERLNQLIGQPFPVGTDGSNAIESLEDIISDDELMDIFKELADVNPESDVRDVLKDYIQMKDEELGTNVLSQLQFGEEDAGMDAAPEPEEAPMAAEPAAEPAPAEEPTAPTPVAEAISKAIRAGATESTVITIKGRKMTIGEAAKRAGVKTEDIFNNKSNELVEFVKSMFNKEEGTFPKGETGVLIACEKKFGEGAVPMAKQVIGKLQQLSEMNRIKKLAGMAR